MGILYIVPTPVGNMEDMTFRAVRILKEVDLVLAEDTRTSGILLKHYEIKNSLMSHHKFNEHGTSAGIVNRLLAGENVALISDAGTPGISDPGFFLVREAVRAGVEVQCLPGATAFVPALVSSGLPCDRFAFEGFLPQKKGRQTKLESLKEEDRTITEGRGSHDDLLRVALSSGEDSPAVCRDLWRRSSGQRLPRDIQGPRGECPRNARRGDSPFQGERTQGRDCDYPRRV